MAVDESLLASAGRAGQGGCLRFYRWSSPTLSLGYFQRHADRQLHPSSLNCPLVRRATGGGAIVHDVELTYSLTLPVHDRVSTELRLLYDTMHSALITELATWGVTAERCSGNCGDGRSEPFLCFQRRCCGDVLVAGAKVAGSAQRRHRGALLQHGSILLGRSVAAPELPGIRDLCNICIDPVELGARLRTRLASQMGVSFATSSLTKAEVAVAESCEQEKYGHDRWMFRS